MRRLAFFLAFSCLLFPLQQAHAQIVLSGDVEDLPAQIRERFDLPGPAALLYNITDVEKFTGQVLEADEIVFGPNAVLELTATDRPWVAIHVKRLRLADPTQPTRIRFAAQPQATAGAAGAAGTAGKNGGRRGRHGVRGWAGSDGGQGESGKPGKTPPTLYLIVGEVVFTGSSSAPKLIIQAGGSAGGAGGNGGPGGLGGTGGTGKRPSSGVIDCKRGPGNSASGGEGGRGGAGGTGGTGGAGSDVFLIGTQQAISFLSFASIANNGGTGAAGGLGGQPGQGGKGGDRVRGKGHCNGSSAGSTGRTPNPPSLGAGQPGADGEQGTTKAITLSTVFSTE